jgi:hypothetical protein
LVAGQILADVEADVSAAGAIEHEDGTRRQVRAPPRPVLRAHRDRRGGDTVFGKARRDEKDVPRSWFPDRLGAKLLWSFGKSGLDGAIDRNIIRAPCSRCGKSLIHDHRTKTWRPYNETDDHEDRIDSIIERR